VGVTRSVVNAARQAAYYAIQYLTDVRHGMVTRDVVFGRTAPHEAGEFRPHEPSPARRFLAILRALPLDPAGYTFVDLGSGKGAALVLAAKQGYGRLVGVEVDGALVDVALRNLRSLRRRRPDLADRIELVRQDARSGRRRRSDRRFRSATSTRAPSTSTPTSRP